MANANAKLTLNQQIFSLVLASEAKLNPNVVAAWVLNEQSGSAAAYYQNGPAFYGGKPYNNWLNIGVTQASDETNGLHGTTSSIWSDPVQAAQATAKWIATGQGVPNWARSSSVDLKPGGSPAEQIAAIQGSGWASGGETALPSLYNEIVGAGGLQITDQQKNAVIGYATKPNFGGLLDNPVSLLTLGIAGTPGSPVSSVVNTVSGAVSGTASLVGALTNPATWIRVGKFAFGSVLMFMGLKELSGGSSSPALLPREAASAVIGAGVERHRAGNRAKAAAARKPPPRARPEPKPAAKPAAKPAPAANRVTYSNSSHTG